MCPRPIESRLGLACERYGPGRLPKADDPAVGAGYAGASAATLATATFAAVAIGLDELGASGSLDGWALAALGAYALPFVVPAAFVAGIASWRVVPETVRGGGVLLGVVGTLLTYVVGTCAFGAALMIGATAFATGSTVFEAGSLAALVGVFALYLTVWVTVPVGCVGAVIYRRVGVDAQGPA